MVKYTPGGVYLKKEIPIQSTPGLPAPEQAKTGTMAYRILSAHNRGKDTSGLCLSFDALASHDITYVGIIQTARASGLTAFPVPYILTCCHNTLCAVGGTINEDDHVFGLSAARKYGGVFVPPHMAVIHQYMRETMAGGGRMILASDSHTRYGPYGTIAVGEGGPELVKQLLSRTYDIAYPDIVAVRLTGKPQPGVGPHDVAIALVGAVFPDGLVKNKVLEFVGDGIANLSMDYRNGIDVMTTETTCLSTIWKTDERTERELAVFGRADAYRKIEPAELAYYDALIEIDLSTIEPMIALPVHPSRAFTVTDFRANAADLFHEVAQEAKRQWNLDKAPELSGKMNKDGVRVDQGVIVGCSGGLYENIVQANKILSGGQLGDFPLSVYPASQPMMLDLSRKGILGDLMAVGATVRSAFCGPCFGAGDVPENTGFSIRHATRNFPSREGSKPDQGQSAFVALMDARSIAATAARGGLLTAATELPHVPEEPSESDYRFDDAPYKARVYSGLDNAQPERNLVFGPNIADWPNFIPLPDTLFLTVASAIYDPVTTTDELIPSGETSSYRSNPYKLSEFALSRKDPGYVGRAKDIRALEQTRQSTHPNAPGQGSVVVALKPGDGSAREQAASCQRVLGGVANIAREYATRRYRANLINWGMLPFVWDELGASRPACGDTFRIDNLRIALLSEDTDEVSAVWTHEGTAQVITLRFGGLTRTERDILLAGCLINYYSHENK